MDNENSLKIFEDKNIRVQWDADKETWYFSVVDIVGALTESEYQKARNYWKWLKGKLNEEGSELVSNTNQLKMQSADGKYYNTDVASTEQVLRLIQSIPSPKAEPFKMLSRHRDNIFYADKRIIPIKIGNRREPIGMNGLLAC